MKIKLIITLIISAGLMLLTIDSLKGQGLYSISTSDGINIIACGDSGYIKISANTGNEWHLKKISADRLNSVCSFNNNFWIAGERGNIYKLSSGDSVLYSINIGFNTDINSIFFVNENTGFICGSGGNVFKTVNGGLNWTLANNGIGIIRLNSIIFKDNNTGYTAGDNGMIYKTVNGGINWIQENSNTERNLLKIKYFGDSLICAGEYGTLLKKGSGNWTNINTRISSDIRGISADNFNTIHICGGNGFIRNNRNGNPDFLNFEANPVLSELTDLCFFNANTGFAVNSKNQNIIKTNNGGAVWNFTNNVTFSYTWENKISGQVNGFGNTLCPHPFNRNTFFAGFTDKVFVSRNKGDTWTEVSHISIPDISRMSALYVSSADTNVWLACVNLFADCPLIRTTNYGESWNIVLDSVEVGSYSHPLEMDQNIPGYFYFAPVSNGFFRSTDNGSTFVKICSYGFNNPCDLTVQYNNSNNILLADASYPVVDSSTVFKSTDNGFSWNMNFRVAENEIPTVENSVFNYGKAFLAAYKFYTSDNFGGSWTSLPYNFESLWALNECKEDPTSIYTSRFSGRGFLSTNGGNDFLWISNPSASIFLSAVLYPEKDYLIAMFHNGLYKLKFYNDVNVGISENNLQTEKTYYLNQNFPNPFNPNTTISYRLADLNHVSLKVYDIRGNEAGTLVNEIQKPGGYSVDFSGENLASGIYFYKIIISSGDFSKIKYSETRKMILLK